MHLLLACIPLLLSLLPPPTYSLLVVTTSPQCANSCGNVPTLTSGQEMTCDDLDYASSTYGATFKQCLTCELSSTYHDTKVSDLQYGIYNLRFALSWCLFGFGNNTQTANTPCLTKFSCGPLQAAFEYDGLNSNSSAYSYCPLMQSNTISIPKCSSCLAEMGNENYLSNFVTLLSAACIQQPPPGTLLSIQGSPFSSLPVNITTPSPSSLSTYTPSTSALTLTAKIGIAVSALVILLALLGFCIVWRGKRRRRRILAEKAERSGYAWQAKHGATRGPDNLGGVPMSAESEMMAAGGLGGGGGQFFDSPQSTRPFANAWTQHGAGQSGFDADSPMSSTLGGAEKAYFSPYQSQWNSPVSATEPPRMQEWPRDTKRVLGLGLDEEMGERIEMGKVSGGVAGSGGGDMDKKGWHVEQAAPVLQHPGHGRGRSGDIGTYPLDDKKGNVF